MGARKRLLVQPPTANRTTLRAFRSFVRKWLRTNLRPIDPTDDCSFDWWISDVDYPKWRKDQLRATWARTGGEFHPRYLGVKSFLKDETYEEYKHARLINSRSDEWKCFVGPIFRRIDKELFANPYFIKKVPVSDRGEYIMQNVHVDGARYISTDYTSYEGQFTKSAFRSTTIELVKWMVSRLDDEFFERVSSALLGKNRLVNRYYVIEVIAKLMSGEMCTSSSNGFSNLMAALFVLSRRGNALRGVVEGDDGLFAVTGECPCNEDFAELGFLIKMEKHDRVSTASFCGLIFDEKDRIVVTNPWPEVVGVGWASGKYDRYNPRKKRLLLRARAMSLASQYGRCPVLGCLAQRLLEVTGGCDVRSFIERDRNISWWERDILRQSTGVDGFVYTPPPDDTYGLVAERYGASIDALKYIESRVAVGDLDVLNRLGFVPACWTEYYCAFSTPSDDKPYQVAGGVAADLELHAHV